MHIKSWYTVLETTGITSLLSSTGDSTLLLVSNAGKMTNVGYENVPVRDVEFFLNPHGHYGRGIERAKIKMISRKAAQQLRRLP
jgi:hypothetical protein